MSGGFEITKESGVAVAKDGKKLVLDPHGKRECAVVSHGHMDHLVGGALMTPHTKDVLKIRKGEEDALTLDVGGRKNYGGMEVEFFHSGHVLGSVMVLVEDSVLYTGDFNVEGGFMSPPPSTDFDVDVLVMEATYGDPRFVFPPKKDVVEDIIGWISALSNEGPIAIGAYEFGKAQEVMKIGETAGVDIFVPPPIASISEVYNRWGADIKYHEVDMDVFESWTGDGLNVDEKSLREEIFRPGSLFVVPTGYLKKGSGFARLMRRMGGCSAYVSGWCSVYNMRHRYDVDAQFPLSDHSDHRGLMGFVEDVNPGEVFLVHGSTQAKKKLAREIEAMGKSVRII